MGSIALAIASGYPGAQNYRLAPCGMGAHFGRMKKPNETKTYDRDSVVSAGPRTLRELGVPGPLAGELELVLRMMGHVQGDRISGFSFRTPDGVKHQLRAERPEQGGDVISRAA